MTNCWRWTKHSPASRSPNPRAAELVKLCFFVGLTQEQAAKELRVSVSTVERKWAYARAWLFREIQKGQVAPESPSATGLPPP